MRGAFSRKQIFKNKCYEEMHEQWISLDKASPETKSTPEYGQSVKSYNDALQAKLNIFKGMDDDDESDKENHPSKRARYLPMSEMPALLACEEGEIDCSASHGQGGSGGGVDGNDAGVRCRKFISITSTSTAGGNTDTRQQTREDACEEGEIDDSASHGQGGSMGGNDDGVRDSSFNNNGQNGINMPVTAATEPTLLVQRPARHGAHTPSMHPYFKVCQDQLAFHYLLARGATAGVYCCSLHGELLACKWMNDTSSTSHAGNSFCRETLFIGSVNRHPNILDVKGKVMDGAGGVVGFLYQKYPYTLREFLDSTGSCLHKSPIDRHVYIEEVLSIFIGVADGLLHILSSGFSHNDVHSKNIAVDSKVPTSAGNMAPWGIILDVGRVSKINPAEPTKLTGAHLATDATLGPASDVYSFGYMLMQSACDKLATLVELKAWGALYEVGQYLPGQRVIKDETNVLRNPLLRLISACLHRSPEVRPSLQMVKEKLCQIRDAWHSLVSS